MFTLLAGGYLVAVGVTGNAGALLALLVSEGAFIPFAVAVAFFYWLWDEASGDAKEPVHLLIIALGMGVLIVEGPRLISAIKTAWSDLNSLSNVQLTGGSSNGGSGLLGSLTGSSGVNTAQQNAFFASILPYAKKAASVMGVPVAVTLAQPALETGYGQSYAFNTLHNPAGINVAGAATGENYESYSSIAQGFQGLTNQIMTNQPGAIGQTTVEGYANALQAGGYATDPNYASKLISIANGPATNFLNSNGY